MISPLSGRALVVDGGRAPDKGRGMTRSPPKAHAKHPTRAATLCGRRLRGDSIIISTLNELAILAVDGGACLQCVATLDSGMLYGRERRWSSLWARAKAAAQRTRAKAANPSAGGAADFSQRADGGIDSNSAAGV